MNFPESLEYLYNLGNEVTAMKLGLTATEKLLAALDNPEKDFLKIQVAGTNGKGSTCAFLDAICQSARIKTGLFTSPHLISITERIKLDGAEISEKKFARHATRVRRISEKLVEEKELEAVPTFFEQLTAIGIAAFSEAKIELAILETGLGGRFDSVTAARAEIVAITPIDYDHQQFLGNTLAEIAAEKAAIIRKDTKVILSKQPIETEEVLSSVCADLEITPKSAQVETRIGLPPSFQTAKADYGKIKLSLAGRHQIENAEVAVLLAETLQELDFKITTENIIEGLQTAEHKGRLEFRKNFLFDGAHNIAGAKALKDYLDEFVAPPITIIFGAMRDKDLQEISEIIFPKAEILIFTEPDNPRSRKAAELMRFLPDTFDKKNVYQTETVEEALKIAGEISGENLICVTGSLYLVGEAQKLLNNKPEI